MSGRSCTFLRFSACPLMVAMIACGDDTIQGETLLLADMPPQEMVIGGKRVIRRGAARVHPPSADGATLTPSSNSVEPSAAPDPAAILELDAMPLEELADQLRLVTLFGGYEYIEAELDMARAAEVRARRGPEVINPPGPPHVLPVTSSDTVRRTVSGLILGGTDNRKIAWDNTLTPYNSYLAVQGLSGKCSAVTIGTRTAISAGHCFLYNGAWNVFDPNHPTNPSFFAPGANIGQPSPSNFPWGKFTCMTAVWMYNGWLNDSTDSNPYWDMAVVDFSGCPLSNTPGWVAGYNGSWANLNFIGNKVVTVFGYPLTCPAPFVGWPQVCGMGGTAAIDTGPFGDFSSAWRLYTGEIDTSGGTSGASWTYKDANNNYYTIGTHRGGNEFLGTTNFARRLENTYWSLVQQASVDF